MCLIAACKTAENVIIEEFLICVHFEELMFLSFLSYLLSFHLVLLFLSPSIMLPLFVKPSFCSLVLRKYE